MKKRILSLLPLTVLLIAMLCTPAFALTEAEVEAQVAASSKEAVTGNVFIWFLCAVAFLKISQKIDSIMASMGINVGRTGGSLLGEAMVAARAVSMVVKGGGRVAGGGRQGGGSSNAAASNGSEGGFFKGSLIGMAGRHITNSAVKTATTQTSAVHSAQKQSDMAETSATSTIQTGSHTSSTVQSGGIHTASTFQSGGVIADTTGIIQTESSAQTATIQTDSSVYSGMDSSNSESHSASDIYADTMAQQEGVIITGHESQSSVFADSSSQVSTNSGGGSQVSYPDSGGERIHTQSSAVESTHTNSSTNTVRQTSIGGAVFARSLASSGKFANDVIGTVARGDIRSTGSITGDMAAQSLTSYMGYTALGAGARNIPRYSDVEIGGGRITGTEYKPGSKEGMAFGMYHAAQYTAPEGPHQKVYSADGTLWFKQYAQDAVERKPYKAPDGTVAYDEKIVKKLPNPPKRKDRI